MEFASTIVERVINFVWDLSVRHVAYVVRYGQNVDELNGSVKHLGLEKERVDHQRDEAEKNLHNVEGTVNEWFLKVSEFEIKVEEFGNDEGHRKTGLSNGLFAYLRNRHRLGRQAKEMAEDVKKLIDESFKFNEVAYRQNVTSNDATLSNADYIEFGCRKSTMEDIMVQLEDSTVRMIGLHGPGGVGKSTLIKAIAKKARDKKLFNVVVVVEITANPNPQKIQEEIAYVLGLRLEGEGENVRADCLRRRLRKEKENTLVILDDLWDRLDLNRLGIPVDDYDDSSNDRKDLNNKMGKKEKSLGDYKGCKILLTSRDKKVLSDKMVVKSIFCVKELDDKDALMLFQKVAAIPDEMSSSKQEIVKKYCAGIPMAIVTVGRALRDNSESVLSVGDFRMPDKYEASRSLALQLKDGDDNIHSQKGIKLLFKRVENLLLGELNAVEIVIYELNLDGFPDLKQLSITNNNRIKYIINSMDLPHPQLVFPNLESLCLYKLMNIEKICGSPVRDASFTKLKTIKVKMCAKLKHLFSVYMVKFLACLETIDVSECNSLKEIIEIPENSDKVEFLNLHSLTLQSLPSFTSFYTRVEGPAVPQLTEAQTTNREHVEITIAEDERNDMAPPLFSDLVESPNLESLNLSSIKIDKIWSNQSPTSFRFQNLIKLVVKDCYKLRYLCSLSVASGLRKLKGLFVSDCQMMEKIFIIEGNNADKVCVFPILEEIHLSKMNMLTDIWQTELSADSFSSLISVHIEECDKLDKIFPSHMEGWFASLDSMKVVNCKSVEVIFEIEDSQQMDAFGGIDTNLQHILVNNLPSLKQMWSTDPGGILNFKKLLSIEVFSCDKLRNVFPASVAKDVEKLEDMMVVTCEGMVEIVAWDDGSETNNKPLVFPELTCMTLLTLSNIKHFYKGRHTIECPKLKTLGVIGCGEKLKTFRTEISESTNEEQHAVFSAEKVIPNLEYMAAEFDQAQKWLWSNTVKYPMQSLKMLVLTSVNNGELLCQFLYRMPNLENLTLLNSDHLHKESSVPCLGTVLKLKELVLFSSKIKDLGFERDPVLQRLEFLSLEFCNDLIKLASPSVSLTHLTYLEVESCSGFRNLMASSTAKSLVQLKTMKVIQCDEIKEIVTNEGNEEGKVMEIVFSKLITVELVALKYLTSFCNYENCDFKFPSLEILIVRECPMMETFTKSHTRELAPKLQNIVAVEGEEEATWQWEGDLNTTIQKVFNDKLSNMSGKGGYFHIHEESESFDYPEFAEQLWHSNHLVQQNYFRNLKRLSASSCNSLVHVIPSHLFPCFENLEELEVQDCIAAQVIFNINETRLTQDLGIIRLKKLSLTDLPKLEHVWDKDPEGIIGLQVLQDMHVESCGCLKSLFPASVAKDLTRLQELKVTDCRELVEIFSKDEKTAEGATKMFVFHCLTSLTLKELPGFKYFYPGLHTLEWPVLENLHAFHCELVTLKCQEDHPEEQVVIQIEKVIQMDQIPGLKKLSFGIGDTPVTWDRESRQLRFDKLQLFQEESDSAPLYRFLDMLPSAIEKLEFVQCLFEEMFSAERPNSDYTRILLHLKELELLEMNNLKSIGLEHSWLQPFPRYLQTLQVKHCSSLKNLVPRTVSFSNLTHLEVSNCGRLLYLFTSSTAKSLAPLKRMKIERCASLQEIVSTEGDESHDENEKIIFVQLQVLFLERLHQLRCFYPGNFTLCFPSLEQVYVIDCSLMKTFSPFNRIDHSTKWFSEEDATSQQCCDLNTAVSTVRRTFEEKPTPNLQCLSLGQIGLKKSWPGEFQRNLLHTLKVLTLCSHIESDVFPYEILQQVPNIEKLGVLYSSFKEIFCCQSPNMDHTGLLLQLKVLHLDSLGDLVSIGLENSWIEPFLRNLEIMQVISCLKLKNLVPCTVSFSNLTLLEVNQCDSLLYLFTSSTAKSLAQLKRMEIKRCSSIEEIVSKEGDESHNDEIIFGKLNCLNLDDLPELRRFYKGSLSFPSLEQLSVTDCNRMGTLCPGTVKADKLLEVIFQGGPEAIPLETDLMSTMLNRKAFRATLTPNLEHLTLGETGLKMIWRGEFQGNLLHKLKVLNLLNFHVESDVFAYGFLQLVPNIEKIEVSSCSFKQIFCFQSLNVDYNGLLSQLKALSIDSLGDLVSIGLENTLIEPFLRNLETLEVSSCSHLRNLAPSPLSFPNLMCLFVFECHRLENLFTSSTVKSLARLKIMEIKSCESIKEIVSKEGDESYEDEIIFWQLLYLSLESLPNLICFYTGSLSFPSLVQLSVINCHRMETLSSGTINADKLFGVKFQKNSEAIPLEIDLNSTIWKAFLATAPDAFSAFDYLSSSSSDTNEDREYG
ncbi:Disease resistance protein RPS2 [Spatholobus suberectus]|nr:Disease resistance protein RPS2 [Spatholobus suberectus]